MNCHEVEPLLSSLLDNELTTEERYFVQQHLQGCTVCWRTLATFQSFNTATLAVLPARAATTKTARRWLVPTVLPRVGAAVLATLALSGSAVLGWLALNNRPLPATTTGNAGRPVATITVQDIPSQVAADQQLINAGRALASLTGALAASMGNGITTANTPANTATVTNSQTLDALASLIGGVAASRPGNTVTASDPTIDALASAIGAALSNGWRRCGQRCSTTSRDGTWGDNADNAGYDPTRVGGGATASYREYPPAE